MTSVIAAVLDQSHSLWKLTYNVCTLSSKPHLHHLLFEVLVTGRGRVQGYIQREFSSDLGGLDLILSVKKCDVGPILEYYKFRFHLRLLDSLAVRP